MDKTCSKCGVSRPVPDGYFRDRRIKAGYRSVCKQCDMAIYRPADRSRRPRVRPFRPARPSTERSRARDAERARKRLAWQRANSPEYRAKKTAHDRRYRQSEAGRMTHRRAKSRRRQHGGRHTLTAPEWKAVLAAFSGRCAYCGTTENITADHLVPLALGGSTSAANVVPACHRCNSSKQDTPPERWCTSEQLERVRATLRGV